MSWCLWKYEKLGTPLYYTLKSNELS
jgi:hypothetical protein